MQKNPSELGGQTRRTHRTKTCSRQGKGGVFICWWLFSRNWEHFFRLTLQLLKSLQENLNAPPISTSTSAILQFFAIIHSPPVNATLWRGAHRGILAHILHHRLQHVGPKLGVALLAGGGEGGDVSPPAPRLHGGAKERPIPKFWLPAFMDCAWNGLSKDGSCALKRNPLIFVPIDWLLLMWYCYCIVIDMLLINMRLWTYKMFLATNENH